MFPRLCKSLDCRMKELLTSEGVGVTVNRAYPVSASDEIAFWNDGVFNMTTSKGLSFAVFFYSLTVKYLDCVVIRSIKIWMSRSLLCVHLLNIRKYCLIRGTVKLLTAALNIDVFVRDQSYSLTVITKSVCMRFFSLYLSMIPQSGPFYRKPLLSELGFGKQCV